MVAHGPANAQLGQSADAAAGRPEAIVAGWDWDGRRLVARNDRFGLRPLFYARLGATASATAAPLGRVGQGAGAGATRPAGAGDATTGGIAVSPSIPRLLDQGVPADLDDDALAVFLRTGYFIGQDTPFRAIRALPPGGTLTWDAADGRLAVTGGLALPPPRRLDRERALDRYTELLRAAVRRRLPPTGTLVMPLSGGRDSRHILLELVAAGAHPATCVTVRHYPPRLDHDAEYAERVAGALGLPHQILDQTRPRRAAEERKNLLTGFCSDEGAAFMRLGEHLDVAFGGQPVTVFDGIGGDFLSDGRFLTTRRLDLLAAGRLDDLADDFSRPQPDLAGLLTDDAAARMSHTTARARLAAELARHLDAASPLTSYIFQNRCRREIATFPFTFYGPTVDIRCPYLDAEVADFLLSLPPDVFLPPSFHADAIRRAFPAIADIPFESPLVRYDDGYRTEMRALFAEILAELEERPSRLLSAEKVRARVAAYDASGRPPSLFAVHLIYLVQLERFVAGLPGQAT